MKIGIINMYSRNAVNYGNILQAYALNHYLRDKYPNADIETILWKNEISCLRITSYTGAVKKKIRKKISGYRQPMIHEKAKELRQELAKVFTSFADSNIALSDKTYNFYDLKHSDYDILIVGSDIVWRQSHNIINRVTFLDFTNAVKSKKIAYAASFGCNYIPKENKRYIKKYLSSFSAVSVREAQSVDLLHQIGFDRAKHVLDPTLLLSESDWSGIEKKPKQIESVGGENCRYAFVYLLEDSWESWEQINVFCKRNGLVSVFVPFIYLSYDGSITAADLRLENCSPEEWLWLLHHAECVITDSFHGAVLSTVFKKKFFVISRINTTELNFRMQDYLQLIGQQDKMVDISTVGSITDYQWDYDKIDKILYAKKEESISFINQSIG